MRPFFIVCTPRSGSTLLHGMLSRHPDVAMPPETHFMALTWRRRDVLGDIATDEGWARARAAVLMSIRKREFDITEAELDEAIADIPRTYASLLRAWLGLVAHKEGCGLVGEKTPNHMEHVVELLAMFPGACALHITRDPRDVVAGNWDVWKTPPVQTALRWRRDQLRWREYARLLAPDRLCAVRYEDLVTEPRATLAPVCETLGIGFREEMLDPGGRRRSGIASDAAHQRRTLRPISRSRIGRYKQRLNPGQIAATEAVCAELMDEAGYQPEFESPARRAAALAARIGPTVVAWGLRRQSQQRRISRRIEAAEQERPDRTLS